MVDQFLRAMVLVHMLAGGIALVVAPLAMIVAKGSDRHRLWGKTFFFSMAVVCVSAVIVGVLRPNILMLLVAVFSFQMISSGYRALYLKRLHEGMRPGQVDFIILGLAGLANGAMFLWGVIHLFMGHRDSGPMIFLVFGTIGLFFIWRDVQRFYSRDHDKREWLYAHMTGFLGGYIATVSAFSAVNLDMIQPLWLRWLWPTIIGVPLIVLWVRYYKKKFTGGRRSHELLDVRIKINSRGERIEDRKTGNARGR